MRVAGSLPETPANEANEWVRDKKVSDWWSFFFCVIILCVDTTYRKEISQYVARGGAVGGSTQ